MIDIDRKKLGQILLQRGFRDWFLYMFKAITGNQFTIEPMHEELFKSFQDIFDGQKKRTNINLPPRAGKTTIAKYFVVYTLTVNPKSQIIYTSYSQSLLATISEEIANILEHEIYKALYPQNITQQETQQLNPIDNFWAEYLYQETGQNKYSGKKITTYAGGILLFASMGSQITGYGCFDYNTLVKTNKGNKKIGDIVENREQVKVLSYNFKTKKKEWHQIDEYVKNDMSKFMLVELDNGDKIEVTPDHLFYLQDGTTCKAENLMVGMKLMTNSFNLNNRYTKFIRNIFSGVVFVHNKLNLLLGEFFKQPFFVRHFISLKPNPICHSAPSPSAFNVANTRRRYAIFGGYLFILAFVLCYFYRNFSSKFSEFPVSIKFIVGVFLGCAIAKIAQMIICWVRIFMSNFKMRLANKSKHNQPMNKTGFFHAIWMKFNNFISFFVCSLANKPLAFFAKHIARFIDKISRKFRNRKVINIVYNHNPHTSYCLSIWDNNNFYLGKNQVLVHNCGQRNSDIFSGMLIMDDPQKPADIKSQIMRERALRYFEETLLSRLNNPNVPIINIQQRLHVEDLSGLLDQKYNFLTIKFPLLDEHDVCQLPSQYTPERINELKTNNYMFSAQYQQSPIFQGGGVFRHEWWRYYKDINDTQYKRIFITADTANKTKEWNDYTAIGVWGLTINNRLRLLDLIHAKMEMPELQQTFLTLWDKWKMGVGRTRCTAIYIEDKASGTQVIQTLKRQGGLPIMAYMPDKDKLSRALDCVPQVAAGNIELPENEHNQLSREFLIDLDAFSADGSALHDDICFAAGTKIATPFGDKNIEDIKIGDKIITPMGVCKCINCGITGYKETIKKFGIEATPNHKVFCDGVFEQLDRLTYGSKISIFSLKELLQWKYKKILYSMESTTNLWGREGIISLNQIPIKDGSVPKDFTLRFGNIIREKKFRKAISFITKTTTTLTMTFLTWSAYHAGNILKCTKKIGCVGLNPKNAKNILKRLGIWHLNGTNPQRDLNGIEKTQKNSKNPFAQKFAIGAKKNTQPKDQIKDFVQRPATANTPQCVQRKKTVYNLTVDNAHCYYANGILVSNCDCFTMACNTAYSQRGYF